MAQVQIMSLGKYKFPQDKTKPYYCELKLPQGQVMEPMTEKAFFMLVNGLVQPIKQMCGMIHAPSVTIPDEQLKDQDSNEKG